MDERIYFLVAAVLITGAILLWLMSKGAKTPRLNQEKFRSKWLEIENTLSKENPTTYSMCILRADSLLDEAMRTRGFKGSTMGERLKSSQKQYRNINSVWAAHKLRNKLAHESDYHPTYEITKQALTTFKNALKDLRAI